jgi:hypothetical protein
MVKIARRSNLTRQSAAHFLAYFENAFNRYIVRQGGLRHDEDPKTLTPEEWAENRARFGSISKEWVMNYSFVEQNIIPGWVNQARIRRGRYDTRKLMEIAKEQIKLEEEAVAAKEAKAKAAAEAKEAKAQARAAKAAERANEKAKKAAAKAAKTATPKESAA